MFSHYIDLAWRSFKRTPLVSILMVLAIAVGIGITMTSLSVYHMMSMDPIPSKSDQLFNLQLGTMDDGNTWWTEDDLPHQITYKDAISLYQADTPMRKVPSIKSGFTVHMNSDHVKPFLESTRVTGRDFFAMFNLEFLYGDTWSMAQEKGAAPVVVISEELNDKLFGGENSIGKQIYLDDASFQIVGVTKKWNIHIKYYDINNGAFVNSEKVFIPFSLIPAMEIPTWGNTNSWKYEEVNTYQDRLNSEMYWIQFWVELTSPKQETKYREFLSAYLDGQGQLGRYTREKEYFGLRNVNQWLTYNNVVSEENRILVGLSFMFLVVCLANILGLLLGKFLRRAPEVGVRRALGASKRNIFMQHLVEVSLLGFMGGILGIGLAQLGLWGVRSTYSYYSDLATMDLSMLLAAPVIAISACVVAGLYPAWLVCRTTPALYLKTQ
ncbi:ABC transporter permease [uncultured Paraglaciecola sp.]|uniref:ABC transporter permease n=1 Tax=uncultured Paraglaciecola sp. TaxID=1765024 RepID=UPI002629D9A7|nr:ABC transporter permease [uncultured Paraglaciecola sp.]